MEGSNVSTDHVIAELVSMGFEFDQAIHALEIVGPHLENAVEFILNGSCNGNAAKNERISSPFSCSTSQAYPLGRRASSVLPSRRMKQSSIIDHVLSSGKPKRRNHCSSSYSSPSGIKRRDSRHVDEQKVSNAGTSDKLESISESSQQESHADAHRVELKVPSKEIGAFQPQEFSQFFSSPSQEIDVDWEPKVRGILQKHFGFSSLKSFQKEALEAWLTHRDCLVLAATGSGKSLCFQIPALLTGKIVVVISPLISLMHDQCLKLARHGISACFLGSGQPDRTVECKALSGVYKIIYVCPETILRLMEPLKRLAENPGIALFAIDEVHCVSKWGHDFRPDYRRLSILRETFTSCNLNSLKFDIPLMALTATATIPVREDIISSLLMSKETKIVLTSFFRPNLRFSVKHSRTSSPSSYDKDFKELIKIYAYSRKEKRNGPTKILNDVEDNSHSSCRSTDDNSSDADEAGESDFSISEDECVDEDDIDASVANGISLPSEGCQLTAEYLEDEVDIHHSVDDLDVSCGEFPGDSPLGISEFNGASKASDLQQSLQQGPTIIYVPTRKETLKIAEFFSKSGVRAAAYHAKLPKSHLRRVHEEFHQNTLEVVVATIAFGMGIDKSNVRRIIHYGWPQSLEAYYQEAGRAGRDGKLSDCTLYANLSRIPTLLPSQRSEEQTKQAYKMLSDCFRYGMNTTTCRAKTLVKYFGEEFSYDKCQLCDVCLNGPPEMQNLMEEAILLMRALRAQHISTLVVAEHEGGFVKPSSLSAVAAAGSISKEKSISILLGGSGTSLQKAAVQAASCHPLVSQVLVADADMLAHPLAETWAELIHLVQQKGGYSYVVAASNSFGKNVIPRAAALLDVSPITDVIEIFEPRIFVRPIYAGNALCTVRYTGLDPCVITIRSTSFSVPPISKDAVSDAAPITQVDLSTFSEETLEKSKWLKLASEDTERPDLGNARIVVTGGRGLKSADNFKLLEKLAEKLGAAVGATRAAVDAGFVPNDLQVGQTGKIVAPDLYIAFGVSGAIQHLAGMRDSKVIVAINKDADAPIFQVADYGLVADLFDVIPELIEKLPEKK